MNPNSITTSSVCDEHAHGCRSEKWWI